MDIKVKGIKKDIGAGDIVKMITDALNIRLDNCNCKARQAKLNQWLTIRKQTGE